MLSHRMDEEEVLFPSSKGISVTWTNLTVVAEQRKNRVFKKTVTTFKKVIHNVNGAVEAGTLVAILGASGSGKSTLMCALANRSANDLHVDGHIRIGRKPIGNFVRHLSGFVYQNDLFFPTLTVYEHLNFTAKLRLEEMSENRRKNLIYQILRELGLIKVANSVIGYSEYGNEKMNLSGGERKRLSIANELLTDPSLLFCDEPTTGLDSFTALKVINNLKYLVDEKQKTIICSVHQPNEKIFGLFHQIILLSGGKIAFIGSSIEALEFFRSQGYAYVEDQNPADYLIKSLASVIDAPEATNKLCSAFKTSEYYIKMMTYIKVENEKEEDAALFRCRRRIETPWFLKLWYATHRNLIGTVRDSSIQKTRIVEKIVLGTIIGVCLGRSAEATQTGLQTIKGIVFMLTAYNFFPPMHAVMDHIPKQLPIFFREYANNTNSPLIFYLSNVLSMLPGFLVDPICFTTLVYCLTTSSLSISTWLLTCLITALVFNVSTSFGMFMSTAFSNRDIAEAYTFVIENIYFVCTGIFIKLSAIPISLTWIRYISWFTYAVEALYIIYLRNLNYIECSKNPNVPCLDNGSEVLASLGFNKDNLWFNVVIMLFIYFFIHFIAYIGLLYRIRSRTT